AARASGDQRNLPIEVDHCFPPPNTDVVPAAKMDAGGLRIEDRRGIIGFSKSLQLPSSILNPLSSILHPRFSILNPLSSIYPPAMASTIESSAPSRTRVASLSRKRTSSPST